MNFRCPLAMIAGLAVLGFLTGCQSTLKTTYNPTYTTTYFSATNVPVRLAAVSDRRGTKPTVYYGNATTGDMGQFDQPLSNIVQEAIVTEFRRAGFALSDTATRAIVVSCEVLDFKATVTQPSFRSLVLDLSVVVAFEWKDPGTNRLLARNERSERRSRKLGMGSPMLPFDQVVIQGYGEELVNDMLPRVIEKELQLNPLLQGRQFPRRQFVDEPGEAPEPLPPKPRNVPPGGDKGSSPFEPSYVPGLGSPEVVIMNDSRETITVRLSGPEAHTLVLAPHGSVKKTVKAGGYSYNASAPGVKPDSGTHRFEKDYRYSWTFSISTSLMPPMPVAPQIKYP